MNNNEVEAIIYQNGIDPQDPDLNDKIISGKIVGTEIKMSKLLVEIGFAKSNTQARTLIKQGGVCIDEDKRRITNENATVIFVYRNPHLND